MNFLRRIGKTRAWRAARDAGGASVKPRRAAAGMGMGRGEETGRKEAVLCLTGGVGDAVASAPVNQSFFCFFFVHKKEVLSSFFNPPC